MASMPSLLREGNGEINSIQIEQGFNLSSVCVDTSVSQSNPQHGSNRGGNVGLGARLNDHVSPQVIGKPVTNPRSITELESPAKKSHRGPSSSTSTSFFQRSDSDLYHLWSRLGFHRTGEADHPRENANFCNLVFAVLFLLEVFVNYDSGAIPAALSIISSEFELSSTWQGTLGALPYVGLTIASPAAGRILSKLSPKRVIMWTMAFNIASSVLMTISVDAFMILTSRFACGLTQSAFVIYAPVWVDEYAPVAKTTLWMGLIQGAIVIGVTVGYLVAGFISHYGQNWRWSMAIQNVFLTLLVFLFTFFPSDLIDSSSKHKEHIKEVARETDSGESELEITALDPEVPCSTKTSLRTFVNLPEISKNIDPGAVNSKVVSSLGSASPMQDRRLNIRIPESRIASATRSDTELPKPKAVLVESRTTFGISNLSKSDTISKSENSLQFCGPSHKSRSKMPDASKSVSSEPDLTKEQGYFFDSTLPRCAAEKMVTDEMNIPIERAPVLLRNTSPIWCSTTGHNMPITRVSQESRNRNMYIPSDELPSDFVGGAELPHEKRISIDGCMHQPFFTTSPAGSIFEAMQMAAGANEPIKFQPMHASEERGSAREIQLVLQNQFDGMENLSTRNGKLTRDLFTNTSVDSTPTEATIPADESHAGKRRRNPHAVSTAQALRSLSKSPVYIWTVFTLCALLFVVTGVQYWATKFFTDSLKVQPWLAMVSFSATAATAPTAGVLMGGFIIDKTGGYKSRSGMLRSLLLCTLSAAIAVTAGIFAGFLNYYLAVIMCIWILLCFGGALLPPLTGILIASVDMEIRTFASGFSMFLYNIFGYALGTFLPGVIMDIFNASDVVGMRLILFWSIFGLIGVIIATLAARRLAVKCETRKTYERSVSPWYDPLGLEEIGENEIDFTVYDGEATRTSSQ